MNPLYLSYHYLATGFSFYHRWTKNQDKSVKCQDFLQSPHRYLNYFGNLFQDTISEKILCDFTLNYFLCRCIV